MKGIVLAGGSGTRLYPLTRACSKQLLPIYDKPMIYYPLATLMSAGIRDITIITTRADQPNFQNLLGHGRRWGIELNWAVQDEPRGIAEAFLIASGYIGSSPVTLILGDNIFHGDSIPLSLGTAVNYPVHPASIFAYQVKDPERYGVVELNSFGIPLSIEEKPKKPKSSYAVTGLYVYDNDVIHLARDLRPSARGELEITDINQQYLEAGKLLCYKLDRGSAWLDTGTHQSLVEATAYVQAIENRQGVKICCPEETAFRQGWISADRLYALGQEQEKTDYGQYLMGLVR